MFLNLLKILVVMVTVTLSGCMVVGGIVGASIGDMDPIMGPAAEKFPGAIEVGNVKTNDSVNVAIIKRAVISSVVFNKDMTMPNATPSPSDVKVNVVIAEEAKRVLGISGSPSPVTVHVKTFYFDEGWYWGYYYYEKITEKNTLTRSQKYGMQKLVSVHFTVERGNSILLEVHGLWGGNKKADEIAGARQLAREMASAVLKKLNSPASRSAPVAEAKKD